MGSPLVSPALMSVGRCIVDRQQAHDLRKWLPATPGGWGPASLRATLSSGDSEATFWVSWLLTASVQTGEYPPLCTPKWAGNAADPPAQEL